MTTKIVNPAALEMADAIGAIYADSTVHLTTTDFQPTSTVTEDDLDEADYSGYAAQTVDFGASYYPESGTGAAIRTPTIQFSYSPTPSVAEVTNTVYGWYLKNSDGDLIVCGDFDNPIAMSSVGHSAFVAVELPVGQS